jgi:hypothetical protein
MDKGTERWRRRTWRAHLAGGVLLAAVGVASLPLFVTGVLEKYRARAWPTARARVISTREAGHDGRGAFLFGREVELSFNYRTPTGEFNGTQKVSWAFAEQLGVAPSGRLIGRYVADTPPVPCWYDPSKPLRAVVQRDLGRNDLSALIPLAFIAGGVGVVIRGRRVVRDAATGPAESLRLRNAEAFGVTPLPEGGARCVPKPPAKRFSLAGITSAFSPHPLQSLDVLDLPLRLGGTCRFRVLLRAPGGSGSAGVTVDLQAGVPRRGTLTPERVVWTERLTGPSSAGPSEVIEVELPDAGQVPDGADDWWLRVVAEAGPAVHPPAFLLLPVESPDAEATHEPRG